MPGPRTPTIRPSRKTTARSYSFRILIPLIIRMITITRNVNGTPKPNISSPLSATWLPLCCSPNFEHHTLDTHHFDLFTDVDFVVGFSPPSFAMNKNLARRNQLASHLADFADEPLHPQCRFRLLRAKNQVAHGQHKAAKRRYSGKNYRAIDDQVGTLSVEEKKRAQSERNNPADAKHAEAGRERLADQQADPEDNQPEPGIVDRQQLQRREGQQQTNRSGHAGKDHPGMRKFHVEAENPRHHEQIRDIRIGDGIEYLLLEAHPIAFDAGALKGQFMLAPVDVHFSAMGLLEQ